MKQTILTIDFTGLMDSEDLIKEIQNRIDTAVYKAFTPWYKRAINYVKTIF